MYYAGCCCDPPDTTVCDLPADFPTSVLVYGGWDCSTTGRNDPNSDNAMSLTLAAQFTLNPNDADCQWFCVSAAEGSHSYLAGDIIDCRDEWTATITEPAGFGCYVSYGRWDQSTMPLAFYDNGFPCFTWERFYPSSGDSTRWLHQSVGNPIDPQSMYARFIAEGFSPPIECAGTVNDRRKAWIEVTLFYDAAIETGIWGPVPDMRAQPTHVVYRTFSQTSNEFLLPPGSAVFKMAEGGLHQAPNGSGLITVPPGWNGPFSPYGPVALPNYLPGPTPYENLNLHVPGPAAELFLSSEIPPADPFLSDEAHYLYWQYWRIKGEAPKKLQNWEVGCQVT